MEGNKPQTNTSVKKKNKKEEPYRGVCKEHQLISWWTIGSFRIQRRAEHFHLGGRGAAPQKIQNLPDSRDEKKGLTRAGRHKVRSRISFGN